MRAAASRSSKFMSLYGSIQMAGNTLQAMQIGLHVVGNNIANANTPGYAREQVIFTPAPVQRIGNLTLGLGVRVAGIVQGVDNYLESRLRDAGGDLASADVQDAAYTDLQSILGELSDSDVSTALTNFFNSVDEINNSPEDFAIRNLASQSGKTLATSVQTLSRRVRTLYQDFGQRVDNIASEINSLTEEVRKLNLQIVTLEGGNSEASEAGGLRSQRSSALKRLSEIADVKVNFSDAGAANVSLGGEFLVFEGTRREVSTVYSSKNGQVASTVVFADNGSEIRVGSGELSGIYEARDKIVGGFLGKLDEFAAALAFEFNKIFSQGQGATGFSEVTSVESVSSSSAALDDAGLAFTPDNGQFDLLLYNKTTKNTKSTTIKVDLLGLDGPATTLSSLAAQIDAIDGVTAEVTADNRLRIRSDSAETAVGFSGDTSGALAALGINTFFTGSTAADLSVNAIVLNDGTKFTAATDGIGVGTDNSLRLVALYDTGLDSLGGSTITGVYDQLISETAQGATVAKALKDGFDNFKQTLDASAQAVSGVNLDEEAIDLIQLQRTYQASAKFIATLSELLDTLVNL